MIQLPLRCEVLVAIEAVDGTKGIDSLVRVWPEKPSEDAIFGCVFVFRSRKGTSIRLPSYDGKG
jgi:transposase